MSNKKAITVNTAKKRRKWKRIMLYLIITILCMVAITSLVLIFHPSFGGNPTKEQKKAFEKLENYQDGSFLNLSQTEINMSASNISSMIRDSVSTDKSKRYPTQDIPVVELDWDKISLEQDSFTWLGHSTFILNIDDKLILVDPMLGNRASPFSNIGGSKRYSDGFLNAIKEFPTIDAVLITHDHYDHLDYETVLELKEKALHYYVPLGVGSHLIRWGVEPEMITELNWWDELEMDSVTFALTPSQHFSGRSLFNRNSTLWGGWVISGKKSNVYISGDGGYGQHFKEIGEKYGPFDMTLIEGAQYDDRWNWVHMRPEEAVQAHMDLNGKNMMLSHWGAFTLAFHGWTEPIERGLVAAEQNSVSLVIPFIGETVVLNEQVISSDRYWWKRMIEEK